MRFQYVQHNIENNVDIDNNNDKNESSENDDDDDDSSTIATEQHNEKQQQHMICQSRSKLRSPLIIFLIYSSSIRNDSCNDACNDADI